MYKRVLVRVRPFFSLVLFLVLPISSGVFVGNLIFSPQTAQEQNIIWHQFLDSSKSPQKSGHGLAFFNTPRVRPSARPSGVGFQATEYSSD
jgi:hypothetical protein